MTAICPVCGRPAVERMAELDAHRAPLTVRLAPVAVAICEAGHQATRLTFEDIVPGVREQVTIAGRRRLGRTDRCGLCSAALVLLPRHTQTPVPVIVEDDVVTVLLECPMVRCPECGREQVPSEVDAVLDAAVAAALAG